MLSTPIDVFVFMCFFATLIFLTAVLGKSPVLGSFSGLIFILTGVYGLVSNLYPLTAPLSEGFSVAVIGVGLLLFLTGAVELVK